MAERDPIESIRRRALRLLDRQAYSCGELAERLVSAGHDRGDVDAVIGRLAACGLLDDEAYARALAEATIEKKPASAELLRRKLERRRVPAETAHRVVEAVLAGVDPVEAAGRLAGRMLAGRRQGSAGADRRRISAALSRRGFDADIIHEALERAGLPAPEDSMDQEYGP